MTTGVTTELRVCAACRMEYVTAPIVEQAGGEWMIWEEPCPYCRATPVVAARAGEMRIAADPR